MVDVVYLILRSGFILLCHWPGTSASAPRWSTSLHLMSPVFALFLFPYFMKHSPPLNRPQVAPAILRWQTGHFHWSRLQSLDNHLPRTSVIRTLLLHGYHKAYPRDTGEGDGMSNLREWLGVGGSASSRKEQKIEPTGALGVPRDVGSKRLCLNEIGRASCRERV